MANKKITDVDVVSVINDTDFLFINQGDALKQIKKSDIPKPTYTAEEVGALPDTTKIPSKTSDIENDLGFLTQHQDLSNYIAKDNTEVFDPVNDYNPATKKYVDDNKFSGSYNDLTNTPTSLPASDVFNWAKAETKPSYTANEVGADSTGTAENKVSSHNTAINAHNDIRILIQELTDRLNALADSDDTTLDQMSEIVAYIKSNRTLIEDITTGKISTSDIIDDLITNVSNKPLSAAQGVVLKGLIDAIVIPTKTSDLTNDSGFLTEHQDISEKVDRKELASVATSGSYSDLKNIPDLLLVNGDSQNNIVTFESTDSIEDSNILWNDVGLLQSEETHKSLFNKISTMFKNIRYLYKLIGNTDISTISDGTVTGVIDELNGNSYELHSDGYTHYKKYNNGMLEVWGLVSVSYTNGLGTIVFPDDYCFVDYSSYTLFVSPAYVDRDNTFEIMSTQKMSGKLANVYSRKYPGLSDKLPTHDCDFYAIGRWK